MTFNENREQDFVPPPLPDAGTDFIPPPLPDTTFPTPQQKKQKKRKKIIVAITATAAAVAVGTGVFLYFLLDRDDPPLAAPTDSTTAVNSQSDPTNAWGNTMPEEGGEYTSPYDSEETAFDPSYSNSEQIAPTAEPSSFMETAPNSSSSSFRQTSSTAATRGTTTTFSPSSSGQTSLTAATRGTTTTFSPSNSRQTSSTTNPWKTTANSSPSASKQTLPTAAPSEPEESTDYKAEAQAFLNATEFEVDAPIRVQTDYVKPTVKVHLYESDRATKLGWRVEFYVNGTKQSLYKSTNSDYWFEQGWDFEISLEPGDNSIQFELRDNYGNSKIITKEVYFEPLAPECPGSFGTIWTITDVRGSPHYNELDELWPKNCTILQGGGLAGSGLAGDRGNYNSLGNLEITVNGVSYTPIVLDYYRNILRDDSTSIFTPIVAEPGWGDYAAIYIPIESSQEKTLTITVTNRYGLSDTKTYTIS